MNKYRAKPVVIDNIRFHSTAEGNRYLELKMMLRTGHIQGLELQPRYPLHAYKDGKLLGHYVADFVYWSYEGADPKGSKIRRIVEDVKGVITPLSKWKIKHAEAEYNFTVQIVRMGKWKANTPAGGKITKSKRLGWA